MSIVNNNRRDYLTYLTTTENTYSLRVYIVQVLVEWFGFAPHASESRIKWTFKKQKYYRVPRKLHGKWYWL